jgi:hypothetical protein
MSTAGIHRRSIACQLPALGWRHREPEFHEPKLSQNLVLVERLRAVGPRHGRSPGEVAIGKPMISLKASIVNISLPAIARTFHSVARSSEAVGLNSK